MKLLLNDKTSKVFCVNFVAYLIYFKDCYNQTKTRSSWKSKKTWTAYLKERSHFKA
jgi:hypothetical protein